MTKYALLCDYTYFSGNHAAEIACKEEFQLPIDQWGIKEVEIGPFKKGEGNYLCYKTNKVSLNISDTDVLYYDNKPASTRDKSRIAGSY